MQRVRAAATVLELRTALGQLETAVHEEFLSPQFKRKPAPVKGAWLSAGAHVSSEHAFLMLSETVQCTKRLYRSRQVQFSLHDGNHCWGTGKAAGLKQQAAEGGEGAEIQPAAADAQVLEWLPPTVAAVSLRLGALDAALIYSPGLPPARDTLQVMPVPSALHAWSL
jgi:hypothetical protein